MCELHFSPHKAKLPLKVCCGEKKSCIVVRCVERQDYYKIIYIFFKLKAN